MAAPSHGYEPERLTALDGRAAAAATSLGAITSTDPAASEAIAAIRRLQSTLEFGWTPAIRSIRQSTALSGGVPVYALGGGGSSGSWNKSEDGPEPGTCTFEPFNALSALFPGDDDITAEEIVDKVNEILEGKPSEQQLIELGVLGKALDEIANDAALSEAVLVELGPDGLQDVYSRLFGLGLSYPLNPTLDTDRYDPERWAGGDLADLIGDPFNLVVAAGTQRPAGRQVVLDAIDLGADARNPWEAAVLAGLARTEGLSDEVAIHLLDVVQRMDPMDFAMGLRDLGNTMYPELEYDIELLELFVIGNNPIFVEKYIYGQDGFVEGGEEFLADLLETNGFYVASDTAIGESLGDIFGHIVAITPADELVERDSEGNPTNAGVLFDLVDLLLANDLKVPGLGIMEAIGPYLPEIMGSIPGTGSRYSAHELREILKDLFEDLSPAEVEAALAIVIDATLAQLPATVTPVKFNGKHFAGTAVGDMLDQLFGPVAGAFGDVIEDEVARAAFWRAAVNDAFGLIPIPGNAFAKFVIKKGVKAIIDGTGGTDGSTQAAVAAAQAALIENTVVVLWADPGINAQVVETALADWEDTKILMGGVPGQRGGQQLNDARIEEIRLALIDARDNGGPVDPGVFVDLPQIVDLIEEVSDETTLSPERAEGN